MYLNRVFKKSQFEITKSPESQNFNLQHSFIKFQTNKDWKKVLSPRCCKFFHFPHLTETRNSEALEVKKAVLSFLLGPKTYCKYYSSSSWLPHAHRQVWTPSRLSSFLVKTGWVT